MRLLALLLLLAGPLAAQDNPAFLAQRAAGQLEAAQAALAAAERATDRVNALTQTIRAYEEGLTALREGLRRVAIRQAILQKRFDAERETIMRLLGVLQSIEAARTPIALLHPSGPVGTARSGMILSDVTPGLQREAEKLRVALEEIATLRALQEEAAQILQEGLQGVQAARTALSQAISNRTDLPLRVSEDPEALARLIEGAGTLQAFAAGLPKLDAVGAVETDFAASGDMPLPVAGTVLRRAGEMDAAGIARPGIVIATEPRALVITPWAATIRYAGPLLDYGNVMILEPQTGYLLVLAGLQEVYGQSGQVLPAGAPVGLMGGITPEGSAFLSQASDGTGINRTETLYIEIRHNDQTRNPAEWFAID